jgi:hypothetical protein
MSACCTRRSFLAGLAGLAGAALPLPPPFRNEARAHQACQVTFEPRVVVSTVYDPVVFDYRHSIRQIEAIKASLKPGQAIENAHTVGLFTAETMVEMQTDMRILGRDGVAECAQVERIAVTFGFRRSTLYVASNFPRNSCGFAEIHAHEERHMSVDQEMLEHYPARIRHYLLKAARQAGGVLAPTKDEAAAALDRYMTNAFQSVSEFIGSERSRLQGLVDSPAEYARVSRACRGEIARTAGQS